MQLTFLGPGDHKVLSQRLAKEQEASDQGEDDDGNEGRAQAPWIVEVGDHCTRAECQQVLYILDSESNETEAARVSLEAVPKYKLPALLR